MAYKGKVKEFFRAVNKNSNTRDRFLRNPASFAQEYFGIDDEDVKMELNELASKLLSELEQDTQGKYTVSGTSETIYSGIKAIPKLKPYTDLITAVAGNSGESSHPGADCPDMLIL